MLLNMAVYAVDFVLVCWAVVLLSHLPFLMLLLWPILAIISFTVTVFSSVFLVWPVACFVKKDGYLPRWLWWFQTPDSRMDGCNGDSNFCATHKPCWWTYVLWQWRNPVAGFSYMLGTTFDNPKIRYYGHSRIKRLPVLIAGWYLIIVTDDKHRIAFELAAVIPWKKGRCVNARIGWKLGNLYRDKSERIPIVHRLNPFAACGEVEKTQ